MKLHCISLLFCLFLSIVHANSIRSPKKPLSPIPRGLDHDIGHTNSSSNSSSQGNHGKGNPCAGNTPNDRSVWCDYNIDTDYLQIAPDTGVTREYWLEIKQVMLAPDGFERPVWTINGSVPGPTITADWGDWVVVHVTNELGPQRNGTTLHWHGIRQNYTNPMDGVPSITQCPITPGKTMTYKWRAEQYGSSWYHAHIGLLAWEGIYGGIVINGPATANYDVDKGSLFLGDWTHRTVDDLYVDQELFGPVTNLSNGLINGTNVYQPLPTDPITGQRFTMQVNQGTSYRLRLVNPSIDTFYQFSIDGHSLEVIAMDLVPIVPFKTDVISMAMGQRYDVIVTANKGHVANSFWMRAVPTLPCSGNDMMDNIRGIMHYGENAEIPTTIGFPVGTGCDDMPIHDLVPWVKQDVEAPFFEDSVDISFRKNADNFVRWEFNSSSLNISWEDPTLMSIYNDEMDFTNSSNVIELPGKNQWVYLLINTTLQIPHPIHLHGHDFSILAQGTGVFDGTLVTKNPPRRDTAMLPGAGWLFVAFQTDNPGAWLMHCHIGWHVNEGLALQFIERYDEIRGLIDYDSFEDTCSTWRKYDATRDILQEDSGV